MQFWRGMIELGSLMVDYPEASCGALLSTVLPHVLVCFCGVADLPRTGALFLLPLLLPPLVLCSATASSAQPWPLIPKSVATVLADDSQPLRD